MDWVKMWERYSPLVEDFVLNFFSAIIIFIIGWFISKWVARGIRRMAMKSSVIDNTAVPMIQAIVLWTIRIIVVMGVLTQFGIKTTSFIAALGAAGLAIGLALQGTLQNIAAGIMLIMLRPIRTGESVDIISANVSGVVSEISLFLTRIIKYDGIQVTIPNSVVWGSTITNYSRNKNRRMDILVTVSYGDDLNKAIQVLQEVVDKQDFILDEPIPDIYVSEYRESVVVITIRLWTPANVYWTVNAALMKKVRIALEEQHFQLPVPARISKNTVDATV
ncbi:mechanosensitive ion channel protein MscS [Pelistega indica]|uniref:Small-conductance mechanosensitive channel n=1 Tax=Pelistega indica TaxID=1414851 RepID=V8G732_9BURK|nr:MULTISPECIES: mechanosensitive ion channel family protein [Pelistega]ETD72225.1 mechanosensitive ion channel protein MscS [Pelistega indica]